MIISLLGGEQTVLHTLPRARPSNTPVNHNLRASTELRSHHSSEYNSISALEALASSNGFTLATNNTQNTMADSSKSITSPNDFVSNENNQWKSQQKPDGYKPNNILGSGHSIEMIDLNSQFSLDKATLDMNNQGGEDELDNAVTETLDSGISLPAAKKESRRRHADKAVTKKHQHHEIDRKNKHHLEKKCHDIDKKYNQHEQDILTQDFPKTRRSSESTENLRTENLNSSGENIDIMSPKTSRKSVSDLIDLNQSVDLLYLDRDQANIDSKVPSGFTPLKELQLCIPKLVITKIKERRGSKEIETHSVRTVLPEDGGEVIVHKKRRRSSEETEMQSDDEADRGWFITMFIDVQPPKLKPRILGFGGCQTKS